MSTVLAYTSPAIGHLFPLVPLLRELVARGHAVHVRTLPAYADQLAALGLSPSPIDPAIDDVLVPDAGAKNARQALELGVKNFCARAEYDGPDLRRALEEVDPDVVITDINTWGAACAAEAWGGPWIGFSPYTPPITSRNTPPFGPGLAPMRGPLGRLRDAVARPLVVGAAQRIMRPWINDLRAGYGLPPVRSSDDFFRRPDRILVTTAEPFEYPHPDWEPQLRMIGATAWEPETEAPAWLAEIEGPVVLVTTSSEYQADEALVSTALEALADEPYTVVATMPAGLKETRVPGNARLEEFVPHGPVLDRAVVAVTHGGMGATQKALARGIPVCVVPFGRDQLEVAARVVASDSGTRLSPRRLSSPSLRTKVREAITKTAGAQRVAEGYVAAGGAAAGADVVEESLGALRASG